MRNERTLLAIALFFLVAVISLAAHAARPLQQPVQPASLVLTNGKIITVETSPAQVEAIAVQGDRIVALGTSADIKRHVGQGTNVIDLNGQLVIPGFVESHGHFTNLGTLQLQLNLMKTSSWQEIVDMVAAAAKKANPGQWIYGRGWHQEKWTATPQPNVEGFPTHESLSRVSPGTAVRSAVRTRVTNSTYPAA